MLSHLRLITPNDSMQASWNDLQSYVLLLSLHSSFKLFFVTLTWSLQKHNYPCAKVTNTKNGYSPNQQSAAVILKFVQSPPKGI